DKLVTGVQTCALPILNEWETTSVDLKKRVDAGDDVLILDVREPNEYQICRIPGSVLIPLGELPRRYAELPKDKDIVAHCKMGGQIGRASCRERGEGRG